MADRRRRIGVGIGAVMAVALVVGFIASVTRQTLEGFDSSGQFDRTTPVVPTDTGSDVFTVADGSDCVTDRVDGRASLDEAISNPDAARERRIYSSAILNCLDDPSQSDELAQLTIAPLEFAANGHADLDVSDGSCIVAQIYDRSEQPARTLVYGTGEGDVELYWDAIEHCVDAEAYGVMTLAPGYGPQNHGDDARLDALHDACINGDDRACDILWRVSSEGSGYERVANDCGGRGPGFHGWCTTGLEFDDSGFAVDGSPGVLSIQEDCVDGDFTACDLLFAITDISSKAASVGDSCGGRLESALPDCRTRFGSDETSGE